MLDQMIDWISTRSLDREYRVGKAFMSGKKDEGINHKAYGVTSLGVHEYLKASLKARDLEGKSFSVKVSGGPDGDVAGNELMNLIRDFGDKVKIMGVIDGTGFLMDPNGIHQGELKRLFTEGVGVSSFVPTHLGEGARLLLIHDCREKNKGVEEVKCLLAGGEESWLGASEANGVYSKGLLKLKTDVFLPCGGRPRTLNAGNWQTFLDEKGEPTSSIIVEGANLFLDEVARKNLEQKGVLIIKDASANKCGVICSSYEIMSGLLLSKDEFIQAKDTLVEQVLEKLILKAGWEAKLLVQNVGADSVIQRSDEVSRAINHWTDAIAADIDQLRTRGDYDAMLDQVIEHVVPKILRDVAGDRIKSLPSLYLDALLSASMASALVYRYGVDYQPSLVVSLGSEVEMGLFK
jgi:glutamate dehydrogenase